MATIIKAFCVRCKKIQPMINAKKLVKKSKGRTMIFLKGKCKVCGTGMAKMLPKK